MPSQKLMMLSAATAESVWLGWLFRVAFARSLISPAKAANIFAVLKRVMGAKERGLTACGYCDYICACYTHMSRRMVMFSTLQKWTLPAGQVLARYSVVLFFLAF